MANNISLIAFGTFGNPNGFKQTFFVGNQELGRWIKTFDLNTNAIKLFPNTKVYAIRKEYANGFNAITYSEYTFAKEQNSDRSGTFIGSSILFTDQIPDERITISQLNEFHNQLVSKNVANNTITVDHSDNFSVTKPKDFDKIAFHLRKISNINFKQKSDAILVVYCNTDQNSLSQFFAKSLDLLNRYDIIYFTSSNEIAEYVHQKGIFKLIQNVGDRKDFEKEINNLMEENNRKRDLAISEFEKEEQRIIDIRNSTLQGFKAQIQQSEIEHSENERKIRDSKENFNNLSRYYEAFLEATKKLTNEIRQNNADVDEINQVHNNNKNLFNSGINDFKAPDYISKIKKIKSKDKIHTEQITDIKAKPNEAGGIKKNKAFIYKVATLFLSLTLIGVLIYLRAMQLNINQLKQEQSDLVAQNLAQLVADNEKLVDLNPLSNANLNANDYRLLAKSFNYNSTVDDVVKIIFDKNPTEIKNYYIDQKDNYSKHLIKLNKQCFEEKDGIYYFTRDTLRVIPSFKK